VGRPGWVRLSVGGDMLNTQAELNKVVVHFRFGKILKGHTRDLTPTKETFHLTSDMDEDRGTIHEIRLADLKAVFFVKSLEGNRDYVEKKRFEEIDPSTLRGIKIKVEFHDGEIIRGVSLGYNKNRPGFYIVPIDSECNNERIYIVAKSVKDVKLGSHAEK
jgi:hypothetical protein